MFIPKPHAIFMAFLTICTFISCTADSDLIADYALADVSQSPGQNNQKKESNSQSPNYSLLSTLNDAYLQGVTGYDQPVMKIGENYRITYLMFDLSGLANRIQSVELQFVVDEDEGSGTIDVYRGSHSDWSEKELTNLIAPETEELLGSIRKDSYPIGETNSIILDSEKLQDGINTLILIHSGGNDLAIASKESTTQLGPKLYVGYTGEALNDSQTSGATYENTGVLKAFPSAYGAGANASGGRGGVVWNVTNLSDSGPGSLREAIEASGPRTIVFSVSGTIILSSPLYVNNGDLTIAGQTAPEGGIDITGDNVYFQNLDNLIIRYIRFRPDWTGSTAIDAVNFNKVRNVIIDHCSITWGSDEAISFVGSDSGHYVTDNVTMQRCLMAYSAKGTLVGYTNYQDGDIDGTTGGNFSILNNYWSHISHRFPNPVTHDRVDVLNNVVHDWRLRLISMNAASNIKLNNINNYYQRSGISNVMESKVLHMLDYDYNYKQSIYTAGNIIDQEFTNSTEDNRILYNYWAKPLPGRDVLDQVDDQYFTSQAFAQLGHPMSIKSAADAFNDISNNVGANATINENGEVILFMDNIDKELISDLANNISHNYNYQSDRSQESRYINYMTKRSTTPLNQHPSDYDTDQDGMPDTWEIIRGLDPSNPNDGNGDDDIDGYTNLEEYLNEIDG